MGASRDTPHTLAALLFAILKYVIWGRRVLILAPHPDDEIIGAGAHIRSIRDLWVVHATDGAPKDVEAIRRRGFSTREEYARALQREALSALRLAGVGPERTLHLEFPGQEVALQMSALARRLLALFRGLRPDTVLAPSYEGGDPDHDAVAMAAQAASQLALREKAQPPRIVEYALYHSWEGRMRTGEFLPRPNAPVANLPLDPAARVLKCRMLACFTTQRDTHTQIQTDVERFRPSPGYNFIEPPHEGPLHYESIDCGMDGREWRRHAWQTLRDLGMVS